MIHNRRRRYSVIGCAIAPYLALAGCTSSGQLLSGEYCKYVSYERKEGNIRVVVECTAPYLVPEAPISPATLLKAIP